MSQPERSKGEKPQFIPVVIPDIKRFLPPHDPNRQPEGEIDASQQFSLLFNPSFTPAYQRLVGDFAPWYATMPYRIDIAGAKYPDMHEVQIGTVAHTMTVTNLHRDFFSGSRREAVVEYLLPTGLEVFRTSGQSVCGVINNPEEQPEDPYTTKLTIYANTLPPLPETRQDALHMEYEIRRAALHPDNAIPQIKDFYARHPGLTTKEYDELSGKQIHERFQDAEIRFDATLLYPEVAAMSPRSTIDPNYHQDLEAMYPERLRALNEGYVTLDDLNDFSLEELPQSLHDHPDAISLDGKFFLSDLRSLYLVQQLNQAGFDVKLVEAHEGLEYPKEPFRDSFTIMIRPKKATGVKPS